MAINPKFSPGIDGKEFDLTNVTSGLSRVDESWPEDEFGAKLSLGPNYGSLLETMGQGDIEMMSNGEAVDPARDPQPGTAAFSERARKRRARLKEYGRPSDPEDAEVTDVVGGSKTSLKKRRKDLEDAGNF